MTTFRERLFVLATAIPAGRVTTYGHLAKAAGGGAQAARSVTSLLSAHPNQGVIPYHRIVYAGGRVWWPKGRQRKRSALFKREGIMVTKAGYVQNFNDLLWDPRELT